MNNEAVQELTKMGLTEYQSKVYSALAVLGPSGVTEINRVSGVPRTKIYETLQELVTKGIVEFQTGRPTLYRSIAPKMLTKIMTESYVSAAKNVESLLEERYESVREVDRDLIWTVRGDSTIRRKLAELLTGAKVSIMMLEVYPPTFTSSLRSVLKSVSSKGVKVRALCVLAKDSGDIVTPESDLIDYRLLSSELSRKGTFVRQQEDPYLKPLIVTLSGPYGVAIIDELEAFVIVPNRKDETRSIGFSAKIPGVPMMMKIMFERLLVAGKRINT